MQSRGFTLVELIIAMSLFSFLAGSVVFGFGQALRSWKQVAGQAEKLQIRNIVAERIAMDIRSASAVLSNSTSQEIFLKQAAETVSYKLVNAKVRRKSGNFTAYLTNENEIQHLGFSFPALKQAKVVVEDINFLVGARN